MPAPQAFTIDIPEAALTDLRQRLKQVRWPPGEIPGSDWDYGANMASIKQLVEYWRTEYDWRAQEQRINQWPHFTVSLDGQQIHFMHIKGKGPKPLPLIISHGWPGSFYEFMEVVGPLSDPAAHGGDPADAFDLVVPSLPGYGFSAPTQQRRVNIRCMADWFAKLMGEVLGYRRYAAQGGDWGALVTSRLGFAYPHNLVGIHLNMVGIAPHPANRHNLSEAEQAWLKEMDGWRREETGYQAIQGTKCRPWPLG